MGRGSGTFPVKEMGHRGGGNLPIGLELFRAVMIPGRVVMFAVIAIRQLLPPSLGLRGREMTYMV